MVYGAITDSATLKPALLFSYQEMKTTPLIAIVGTSGVSKNSTPSTSSEKITALPHEHKTGS
jgi:hypothetical protein